MATEVGKCLYDPETCRCQKFFEEYDNPQICSLCHHHIGWHKQPTSNSTRPFDSDEKAVYQIQQRSEQNNFSMLQPDP